MNNDVSMSWVAPNALNTYGSQLARILHACVHDGASVGFITPWSIEDSLAFWIRQVYPAVKSGSRYLLIGEVDGQIAGTVQLVCDTFPNQAHRADVSKLLVHPTFRKRGIARSLMGALERNAADKQRSLLTLDTISGSAAEFLYLSIGFKKAGEIPDFARAPLENRLEPTTFMYKTLPTRSML